MSPDLNFRGFCNPGGGRASKLMTATRGRIAMRMLIGVICGLLVAAEACADGAPPVQVMVLAPTTWTTGLDCITPGRTTC